MKRLSIRGRQHSRSVRYAALRSGRQFCRKMGAVAKNHRSQNKLSSRPERTRISCHAALDKATCAPFRRERRMKFANAIKLDRKSGGAEWSDCLDCQECDGGFGCGKDVDCVHLENVSVVFHFPPTLLRRFHLGRRAGIAATDCRSWRTSRALALSRTSSL
jgi:hypothetical protein